MGSFCRICLQTITNGDIGFRLAEMITVNNQMHRLSEVIEYICGFTIAVNHIEFAMCKLCVCKANKTYRFKQKCLDSITLWKTIKIEIPEAESTENGVQVNTTTDLEIKNIDNLISIVEEEGYTNIIPKDESVDSSASAMNEQPKLLNETTAGEQRLVKCYFNKRKCTSSSSSGIREENFKRSKLIGEENLILLNTDDDLVSKSNRSYCIANDELNSSQDEKVNAFLDDLKNQKIKSLSCPFCDATVLKLYYLRNHAETHLSYAKYVCKHCGKRNQTILGHFNHRRKAHSELVITLTQRYKYTTAEVDEFVADIDSKKYTELECRFCKKMLKNSNSLKRHANILHRVQSQYHCKKCRSSYSTKKSYREHIKSHTRKTHICLICSHVFAAALYLKQHLKTKHYINRRIKQQKPYRAIQHIMPYRDVNSDYSMLNIKKEKDLIIEDVQGVNDSAAVALANIDDKSVAARRKLNTKEKSAKSKKPVKVRKYLKQKPELPYIIAINENPIGQDEEIEEFLTDIKSKKYQGLSCRFCTLTLSSTNSLHGHAESHLSYQKYVCKICDQHFQTYSYFLQHNRKHKKKIILKKHKNRIYVSHAEVDAFIDDIDSRKCRTKICRFCQKSLLTKFSLKDHVNLHRPDPQYICETCGKNLYTMRHYRKHKRLHYTHLRKCDTCNITFATNKGWDQHVLKYKDHSATFINASTDAADEVAPSNKIKNAVQPNISNEVENTGSK